jgi:hypothetical protein
MAMENRRLEFALSEILLCSGDASPNSQRGGSGPAGYFFPRAKWVGKLRNDSTKLGCAFGILSTEYGLIGQDEIIRGYDLKLTPDNIGQIRLIWQRTIPPFVEEIYKIMIYYSGGNSREPGLSILKAILQRSRIALITYGKPNMYDIGKTRNIIQCLIDGTTITQLKSLLAYPEEIDFMI